MIQKNTPLSEILELSQHCKQCGHCCSHGSGFLINNDTKNIAEFLGMTKKELKENYLEEKELFNTKLLRPKLKKEDKPYGECIFLNNKKCKIHKVKPLQCKVGNCNEYGEKLSIWFMLNYQINKDDPESIRQYAAYLKSGGKTIEGGKLEELVPDKEKLKKILNFERLFFTKPK